MEGMGMLVQGGVDEPNCALARLETLLVDQSDD